MTTGFENGTLVNIIYLWLTNVSGDVSAAAPRVPCGYVEGERSESPWDNRAKRGSWRGAVLLTHFCRRKFLTCRFGENRRSLHRPVQKLLTASQPTAFKPPAARAAFSRFPTSPTGSTTMRIVLFCLIEKNNLCDSRTVSLAH